MWLVVHRSNAESRPEKIGYAAAACGIAAFIPALLGPLFKNPDHLPYLVVVGVLTIVLALTAIALSLWTFRARRHVRSGAIFYPVVALICGVLNIFCGGGIVATGSGLLAPTQGKPWIWRSVPHGFEVTIPSEHWTTQPNPNVLAYFTCSHPHIMAMVAEVLPAKLDAEFEAAMAKGKTIKGNTSLTNVEEQNGMNQYGHVYWMFVGDAMSGANPYVFGVSVTRVGDNAVLMLFEGQYSLKTEIGKEQEKRALRTAASSFLGSVK
jgi:hypothetical protein